MNLLRQLLLPFSVLYGVIVGIRNRLYDLEILKSTSFRVPTIVVGNLNVGGTGKSPMIEYLIRLLKEDYHVAVLSRGYKRTSKGFQLATSTTKVSEIGDEPMQFFRKFKDILVAVDTKRVDGIQKLKALKKSPQVILLDDAYQHRKLQGGYNILLTPYYNLYTEDSMLPSGNLRESKEGASRANVIIVSKCPDLNKQEQIRITKKLQISPNQKVYFSKIGYDDHVYNNDSKIKLDDLTNFNVLLVTGIAKTLPLTDFLTSKSIQYKHLKYKDHYNFTEKNLKNIEGIYTAIVDKKKIILTTEKDYVRTFEFAKMNVFYLPIKMVFMHSDEEERCFINKIKQYVEQSTRDC